MRGRYQKTESRDLAEWSRYQCPSCLPLSYRLGPDVCTILRLSGPLKEQYAKVPRPRRAVSCHTPPSCARTLPCCAVPRSYRTTLGRTILRCAGQCHVLSHAVLSHAHTAPHRAMPCHTELWQGMCFAVLCLPMLMPCYTSPHSAELCPALPHYAVPSDALPCCAELCHGAPYKAMSGDAVASCAIP